MLRFLRFINKIIDQIVDGSIDLLLKVFKSSLKTVQKEIASLLLDYLTDGKIDVPKKQRYKLLKQLDKTLIKQAKVIGKKDIEVTTNILNEATETSYYYNGFLLESGLEEAIKLKPLKENELKAIVNTPIKEEMFSDRIWKNKDKLIKQIRYSVEQAMIHGKDPRKLAKEVKDMFGVTAYESRRLINNEVARVSRQAQDQVYEQNKDIVQKVMFDATLDKKTSKFCRSHDGKIYEFGKHPRIPEDSHVGCRSDIIPIIDDWKPKFKKDNESKEIIPYEQYDEWMKDKGFK